MKAVKIKTIKTIQGQNSKVVILSEYFLTVYISLFQAPR